jgi:uncharacterized protein YjlB
VTAAEQFRCADDGAIPNHSRYPALAYRAVLDPAGGPKAAEALFARNGWVPAWRAGIFPFHHFHSTAHEALAVVSGSATVELGGPGGVALEVRGGDVLVLPAGTGHRRARARSRSSAPTRRARTGTCSAATPPSTTRRWPTSRACPTRRRTR